MDVPKVSDEQQLDVVRAVKDITFGSIAGMVAKVFEHPFDLCKVRLQSQVLDETPRFNGPIDCLYKTWKYEGFRGLYRGLPPPVVGAAAENAVLFLTYNNIRRSLAWMDPSPINDPSKMPLSHTLIAAGGAGAVTSFVSSGSAGLPLPTVQMSSLPGPIEILRSITRTEGIRGLWLGHTGTLIRETGGGVAWFGIKELVARSLVARHAPNKETSSAEPHLKSWESALAGACAGVGYTVLLFPADYRGELRPRAPPKYAESTPPKSTFTGVFKEIYRTRGLKGLYAGCGVTVCRSAPSSALIFLVYDALEKHFGQQ
ncbi:mitochondrial carrier [Cantharellus anzutake]|uniref:mitochondrial carrier n=1 Tax=Cantharellus anzutake TaxID=1750568 RepID=UPI001902F687|nr:mitochondrial carrier [Cantharellus anzutake]KAF8327227.1 mitochondrial carrier [Cantharellus anzutake]